MYDLIIIGGGPAGMQAAITAKLSGLDILLINAGKWGGQQAYALELKNLLGMYGVSGPELIENAITQMDAIGVETREGKVYNIKTGVRPSTVKGHFEIEFYDTSEESLMAENVLLTTGLTPRNVDVFDKIQLRPYVTYLDVQSKIKDLDSADKILIVGSGNAAGQAALDIGARVSKVSLFVKENLDSSMSEYLVKVIKDRINISYFEHVVVKEVLEYSGQARVRWSDAEEASKANSYDHIFILCGGKPFGAEFSELGIEYNEEDIFDKDNYIKTSTDYQTCIPGLYACGDVRSGSIKTLACAIGEGSAVAEIINSKLKNNGNTD